MDFQTNVPMSRLTTMRLGGPARFCVEVGNKQELIEAVDFANNKDLPILTLGEGSNVIVRNQGFAGLVILNRIGGFEVLPDGLTIKIGAGENWDSVVKRTVDLGLSGIEALSAIPGTAGATPVQNVGAYGQEIAQTLQQLEAYDTQSGEFITIGHDDCQFGYRSSRFKSLQDRKYIITSITLRLAKTTMKPPFYPRLQKYLTEHSIADFNPKNIREAVVAVRSVILPDPKLIANAGSFFKNPLIPAGNLKTLLASYPDMPHWLMANGKIKLAAGWLIEQAGLKGYVANGITTYADNALVFVNKGAKSYTDLQAFEQTVVDKVKQKFGIVLQQEPELL